MDDRLRDCPYPSSWSLSACCSVDISSFCHWTELTVSQSLEACSSSCGSSCKSGFEGVFPFVTRKTCARAGNEDDVGECGLRYSLGDIDVRDSTFAGESFERTLALMGPRPALCDCSGEVIGAIDDIDGVCGGASGSTVVLHPVSIGRLGKTNALLWLPSSPLCSC